MLSHFFGRPRPDERFPIGHDPLPHKQFLPKGGLHLPRSTSGVFAGWGEGVFKHLPKVYREEIKKELDKDGDKAIDGGVKGEDGEPIDPVVAAGLDAEAADEVKAEEQKEHHKPKHEPAAAAPPVPPFAAEGVVNPFLKTSAAKPAAKPVAFSDTLAAAAKAAGVSLEHSPLKKGPEFTIPNLTSAVPKTVVTRAAAGGKLKH